VKRIEGQPLLSYQPLADHLAKLGQRVVVGGNKPILLDNPETIWLIEEGQVDLFAVALESDAARRHINTAKPGQMLFGIGSTSSHRPFARQTEHRRQATGILAVGFQDTRLLRLEIGHLHEAARDPGLLDALAQQIEGWVDLLLESTTQDTPPKSFTLLVPGEESHFEAAGGVGRSASGTVWLRHVSGSSLFLGSDQLPMPATEALLPVTDNTWLVTATDEVTVSGVATSILLQGGNIWEAISSFHELVLKLLRLRLEQNLAATRDQLEERTARDRAAMRSAHRRLASILGDLPRDDYDFDQMGEPLMKACRLIGEAQGVEFEAPRQSSGGAGGDLRLLQRICAASKLRYRLVLLRDTWWRRDNGPLLGIKPDPKTKKPHPVALLPAGPGKYVMVEPVTGTRQRVGRKVAQKLDGRAFMFYAPLPRRALSLVDLAKYAFSDQRKNLTSVILMGLASGLLALFVPVITAQLFGKVIPAADASLLLQMTLALAVSAFAAAAFQVTRSIAMLRISGKLESSLQAAVWDRMLALPVPFFRRYSVGDLAERSMGVERIRQLLTGNVATSLLGAVFSVFSYLLLFYYSGALAKVASLLVLGLVVVTMTTSYLQLRHQRHLLELQGKIASLVLGLINGMSKLRVAGAEHRAYARWATRFAEQREVTVKVRRVANVQTAFNAAYGVLTSIVIYGVVVFKAETILIEEQLQIADFLGFMAAFGQFQAASLSLVGVFSSLLTMLPLYERLRPLLAAEPEVDEIKAPTREVRGEIEFSHVSFRYHQDGPLVLRDVSFKAEAGEFIALVGSSGSGKSTMIRLLLGFEEPESGSIFFDGQDLPSLDIQSLRRQIGVVLQHGEPMIGDIFQNIIGNNASLTMDDAWRAAKMAGLAADIEAMPMKMQTVISEGGGTFSGGQRQRLLIARAVVNRPRILIFDEATSALDNRTQELVSRSLEGLKASRIVVAHRLSTILNADRIFVLEQGRVVEQGSYEELIRLNGVFARLAERQIA